MIENIAQTLENISQHYTSKVGLIEAKTKQSYTFGEIRDFANSYGAYLKEQGVKPGDRVMLMVKPSVDFISLTFALFKIGAPVILIDPGMGYRNLIRCIASVKPDYLVGIPPVIVLKQMFRNTFRSVKKSFCCGNFPLLPVNNIQTTRAKEHVDVPVFQPDDNSLAAIIFTTGSTGPPKGVRFEHKIFSKQLALIKHYYHIGPDDVDQPGFPLFGLFTIAMGACAVIPDMDPTKPALVDPAKFIDSIQRYQVSYSFGSPAIWNVVSRYCIQNDIKLHSLKKVLMAGAPVPGNLIQRVLDSSSDSAEVHTPYGATESLPIVSGDGREIISETWPMTQQGYGTCVGRVLPDIEVRIIEPADYLFNSIDDCVIKQVNEVGEIIVKGDVVTRAYDNNDAENRFSKIKDGSSFWHRIGDVGYFDEKKRLWFCGRKAHIVNGPHGPMYTIKCEAIANNHPEVFRSALVGIQGKNKEHAEPVLIIEKEQHSTTEDAALLKEVKLLTQKNKNTEYISHFLIHPSFPVDIRHNAKIFREQLQRWAEGKIGN